MSDDLQLSELPAIHGAMAEFDTPEELIEACPEYRFGQMIANLAFMAREDGESSIWDVEDEEMLAAARKHLADWNESHSSVA